MIGYSCSIVGILGVVLSSAISEIFIFAGTEDEIVPLNWVLEFARAQEATVRFLHDDHRFTRNTDRFPDVT